MPEKPPLPKQRYSHSFWGGGYHLLKPVPNPVDLAIARLCQQFAAADDNTRAKLRAAMTQSDVFVFTPRACVYALREKDPAKSARWLMDGAMAVAMVRGDDRWFDFRDIYWTLAHVQHAAERTDVPVKELLLSVAKHAEPAVSKIVKDFKRYHAKSKLRNDWGYDEVETELGIGLIGWEHAKYRPSYDLKQIIIEIAEVVEQDKWWQPNSVSIADEFGWPESATNSTVKAALKKVRVRAVAKVRAHLRAQKARNAEDQHLAVDLIEADTVASARVLLKLGREHKPRAGSQLVVAQDRLVCEVGSWATLHGLMPCETQKRLLRFKPALTRILKRHTSGKRR